MFRRVYVQFYLFNNPASNNIYTYCTTLSLHNALPISRGLLVAGRDKRVRPGSEDKQLAAWNGMALRALAVGSLVLGDESLAVAARRCAGFIRTHLDRKSTRLNSSH